MDKRKRSTKKKEHVSKKANCHSAFLPILGLPNEVLLNVLEFLAVKDLVTIGGTCQRFKDLVDATFVEKETLVIEGYPDAKWFLSKNRKALGQLVLRFGKKLKNVSLISKSGKNLTSMALRHPNNAERLAEQCPNIEEMAIDYTDFKQLLALCRYAKFLGTDCRVTKLRELDGLNMPSRGLFQRFVLMPADEMATLFRKLLAFNQAKAEVAEELAHLEGLNVDALNGFVEMMHQWLLNPLQVALPNVEAIIPDLMLLEENQIPH